MTDDPRPKMWVGHVALAVRDVAKTKQFFLTLGLRDAEPAAPRTKGWRLRRGAGKRACSERRAGM